MRGGGAAAAVRALQWVKKGRKRGCFLRSREALAEKWQRHEELVQWHRPGQRGNRNGGGTQVICH